MADVEESAAHKRKQLNVEILAAVKDRLEADAKEKGIPIKVLLETILGGFYDMGDLYVEPKDIQRARELLEKRGFRVIRHDIENAQVLGVEIKK